MNKSSSLRILLLALLALLNHTSAFGASGTWTAGASGDWNVDGNWNGASFPGTTATETATFNTNISVAVAITSPLANSALINNRGTGDVVVTGSDFTVNGAAGGGIIFGASDSTSVTSGNITFSNAIVLTSNVTVSQNELGDTAGVLDIAGGIKAATARVLTGIGRFDGTIRLSSLAETPANLRFAVGRNVGLGENMFIEFNVADFGFDRLQINRSTAADGYLIFRSVGADRTVSTTGFAAIIQNQTTNGSENSKIGFGGSQALTMTNSAATPTFYTYNRNTNSSSIEFEQQGTATTTVWGRILASESNATLSNWGGLNLVQLTGSGVGDFIIQGGIEQGTSNAPSASLVVNRATGAVTAIMSNSTFSGGTTLSNGILRIGADGALGTGTVTLIGGTLASASGAARILTNSVALSGDVTLGESAIGTGDLTLSNVSLGAANRTITVSNNLSTITGITSGGPGAGLTKTGTGTLALAGANTYSGDTTISNGSLHIATAGSLAFVIGGNGTNNSITGSGTLVANGAFAMDLSAASTNSGDTWTIVANSVGASYGTNFLVTGFNGAGGNWTNSTNGVDYIFQQSTGVLTVGAPATNNYASWVTYWQGVNPGFTNTAGTDDPDGDSFDNNKEFAFDGNPTIGTPALLKAVKSGTNAVFQFIARKNPPGGVTYQVEHTTNLAAGPWTNSSVTVSNATDQSGLNIPADYERREFTVPASGSDFFRVQATVAP